jgi:hypothetical protein
MKDKELDKLIRKATGQSAQPKDKRPRFVDPTLQATKRPQEDPADDERKHFFKEMKRREF